MVTMFVLLLAVAATLWAVAQSRPQPVKVRRNVLRDEALEHYLNQHRR